MPIPSGFFILVITVIIHVVFILQFQLILRLILKGVLPIILLVLISHLINLHVINFSFLIFVLLFIFTNSPLFQTIFSYRYWADFTSKVVRIIAMPG
jgi:hypothetical protein